MTARALSDETRALLRAAISDAYYEARNNGRTMESAADDAVDRLEPIVVSIDANAHARGAASTSGEPVFCGLSSVLPGGLYPGLCVRSHGHDGPHKDIAATTWMESVR